MDYIKYLNSLKNSLANHRVSLLVGAGFSKNVSSKFLNWAELLYDLVYELYQDEIDAQIPSGLTGDDKTAWKENWAKKKIDKVGYLQIVSYYISKKGMSESIVTYIEKNTPVVEDSSGTYVLIEEGRRNPLTRAQLALHRQLLTLPWNNVYTTNYDPLLEASVDTKLYEQLQEPNRALRKIVSDLEGEISNETVKKEELEKQLEDLKRELSQQADGLSTVPETPHPKTSKEIRALMEEIYKITRTINQHKTDRDQKNKEINANEESLDRCYTVVTNGAHLQLKRNKNIIKLHGSLRTEKERSENRFEFDGDPRKQYIISAEHYENYPRQHEAFTQLMRISLLQESYCTIGFSGADPNFTAWIGWVRDLLYKHATSKKSDHAYKIYQIVTTGHGVEEDRLLFNENHSIVQIPLLKPQIIDYLEKSCKRKLDAADKIRSALHLLIQFLGDHENINLQISSKDTSSEEQWRRAWEKLIDNTAPKRINHLNIDESLRIIQSVSGNFQIPKLHDVFTHSLSDFLYIFSDGTAAITIEEEREKILILALLGGQRYYLPIVNLFSGEMLAELSTNPSTSTAVYALSERNDALVVSEETDFLEPNDHYNRILHSAFSFQFDELQKHLSAWSPEISKLHLKAGFLAWFDPQQSINLLYTQISSDQISEEQRYYSLELLSYIDRSKSWESSDKSIEHRKKQYEKAGYPSIMDHLDALCDELIKSPKNIEPLGHNRFSVTKGLRLNFLSSSKISLQYLMILIESGFPLTLQQLHLHSADNWYYVFKHGFEFYPFPFLYYSLQFKKEPVLRRIGQDVIFSDRLASQHPFILSVIGKSYLDSNAYRNDSKLILLSEMLRAVEPELWEALFTEIWKNLLLTKRLFDDRNNAVESFINSGFRFIENENTLFTVIADLLSYLPTYSQQVISFLYNLNQNLLLTKGKESYRLPENLTTLIDSLIDNITQHTEDNLFALGNINFLLSNLQRGQIQGKLAEVDFSTIQNVRIWRTIVFFADGEPSLIPKITAAITNHTMLWNTGISKNAVSGGTEILRLQLLISYKHFRFSDSDIQILYQKMKVAFAKINELYRTKPEFFEPESIVNFAFCLEEMIVFLNAYQRKLSSHNDFQEIKNCVKLIYDKTKGYSNLSEGLASRERSIVIWALAEFSSQVAIDGPDPAILNLLLNKVLLQAPPAIEATLKYLAFWIEDEKNAAAFMGNRKLIIGVLKKFKDTPLPDADVAFVQEMLFRIAYQLHNWGLTDQIVTEWISIGEASRFNNVRQWKEALHEK